MSWGNEVIVDCRGCNDRIDDASQIEKFIEDLCDKIDMERVGKPVFIFISDLDDKSGWTCFQMIRTSNVTMHGCMNGDAFFNVFSCKDVDPTVVADTIKEWFAPNELTLSFHVRGAW